MTDKDKNEQNTTVDVELVKAYLASEEGAKLIEDSDAVKSLRSKRDELLGEKQTWKQKWEKYEALGDVDTLSKLLEASKNKSDKTDDKNNNVDPDLVESLKKQISERDSALELFKTNYVKTQVDAKVESAIAEAKGNPRLLKHIVQERIKTSLGDDGQVQIEVYTKDGKKMFRRDSAPATIEDLIAELRDDADLGIAFQGSGANGSGTRTASKTTAGGVILDRNDPNFDPSKAMAYYAKHGFKK